MTVRISLKNNGTYAIGVNRNGVSYQAIKKYIHGTQEMGEPTSNLFIKKAVLKGVEMGVLGRSAKTKNASGVVGCFILLKKQKVVKKPTDGSEGVKKTRVRKQQESDSEAIPKKPGRPKKLNLILSDTTLQFPETIDKPKAKLVRQKAVKKNTEPKIEKPKVKEAKKPAVIKTNQAKPKKGAQARDRKDVSDSEMVVKKPNRQSLKSYSSDTEVNTIKIDKTKIKTAPRTETKTSKKAMSELPPKAAKTKRPNKAAEKQTESKDGTEMKVVRTRAKK